MTMIKYLALETWHYFARHAHSQVLTSLMNGKTFLNREFRKCLVIGNFPNNYVHRWLFRRSIVVDGNFSAEHMKMLRPDDDVRLANGEGYMVEEVSYQEHLKDSLDIREVKSFLSLLDCGIKCS
jgi:hypothetical protein